MGGTDEQGWGRAGVRQRGDGPGVRAGGQDNLDESLRGREYKYGLLKSKTSPSFVLNNLYIYHHTFIARVLCAFIYFSLYISFIYFSLYIYIL